jgi:hypothetical protein
MLLASVFVWLNVSGETETPRTRANLPGQTIIGAETDGAEVRQSAENTISKPAPDNALQELKTALEPDGVDGQAGSLPDVQLSSVEQSDDATQERKG